MDVTGVSNNQTNAAVSQQRIAENFDTFLTLLTTQLQNQDPLSPMDSNEFTAQLVQFSEVEQSIATNKNLESLVSLTLASATGSAVSYLGREVTAGGELSTLKNGRAAWSYTLPRDAETTSLKVRDATGKVVYEGPGEAARGAHQFTWDGRGNDGGTLPDGTYSLSIDATDLAGNGVAATTEIKGRVTSVEIEGAEPILKIGDIAVRLNDIRTIAEPAEPPA